MHAPGSPALCCMPWGGGTAEPLRISPPQPAGRRRPPSTEGMVLLPGGEFLMGAEDSEGFRPTVRVRSGPCASIRSISTPAR
jgi:sulfatase modifying factor 1